MRRLSPLLAVAAVALVTAASAAAAVIVITPVSSTLSGIGRPKVTRLTISRNGVVFYSALVRSRYCGASCTEVGVRPGRRPIESIDLTGSGEPDVILGLFTGGAHCCFVDQVFSYDAAHHTYVKTEHDFLDAGPVVRRLDGRYVFASADARIAEDGLTDFAHSGAPIQIWQFAHQRFVDVTRHHPALIRTDAARWLRAARRSPRNNLGLLAAWAADEDMLGHGKLVASTLAADARAGRLHSSLATTSSQQVLASDIQTVLRQLHYVR